MTLNDTNIFIGILIAIAGGGGLGWMGYYQSRKANKKADSLKETASSIDGWKLLVDSLRTTVELSSKELHRLNELVDKLRTTNEECFKDKHAQEMKMEELAKQHRQLQRNFDELKTQINK